ncbi:hypothetical protein N7475_001125 [Penicillium sp. IBT 31633x]|nr:hypothetical protein N7475_001125 [Penicillium sp. IBT 31633x]
MGRWGWRLFEGDQDLDIAMTIVRELGIQDSDWEHSMSAMVSQTDMLTPPEANDYCKTPEYSHELATIVVPYVRGKLDTNNMGDMLFAISKAKETENSFQETRYRTIILGALMLRAGARIREEDRQHLLDLVPQINCTSRRTLLADHGFRTPGRAQFLAALDHYEPGVPRSLQEPSCFGCGKIEGDLGHKLLLCKKCKVANYCGQKCQRDQWRDHRMSCIPAEKRLIVNV